MKSMISECQEQLQQINTPNNFGNIRLERKDVCYLLLEVTHLSFDCIETCIENLQDTQGLPRDSCPPKILKKRVTSELNGQHFIMDSRVNITNFLSEKSEPFCKREAFGQLLDFPYHNWMTMTKHQATKTHFYWIREHWFRYLYFSLSSSFHMLFPKSMCSFSIYNNEANPHFFTLFTFALWNYFRLVLHEYT